MLDTMQSRLNDPANSKYWLPVLLKNLKKSNGLPALPLTKKEENIGAMTGPDGAFIADTIALDWAVFNNFPDSPYAIPSPDDPWPILDLSDLIVAGLDNVFMVNSVSSPIAGQTGYSSTITLQFNYYADTNPALENLKINGRYDLTQAVCSSDTSGGSECNGNYSATVWGKGEFGADINDCYLDADVSVIVSGQGASRALAVTVNNLNLRGQNTGSNPTISFFNVTVEDTNIGDDIAEMAKRALNAPEGNSGVILAISSALNAPGTLQNFSELLTNWIASAFDKLFAPIPASGLPNDGSNQNAATLVDLYLFDRIRVAVSNPDSNWFIPWQVASSADPVLEPYSTAEITFPDQEIGGLPFTGIKLTDVSIANASNVVPPYATFLLNSPDVAAVIDLGALPVGPSRTFERNGEEIIMNIPPAPPVVLTGTFTFTQGGIAPVQLSGTAEISATKVSLALVITPSGADAASLQFTAQSLTVDLSPAAVSAVVELKDDSSLDQLAETLLESQDAQSQISNALNNELAGQLSQLSSYFSEIVRTAIDRQLS
ncbi:MAG: hypothetical protein GKS03_12405 [Alphaproteobacteria bacterium]|nr:hypothetical protein [Alphaproteobacteria bacterium]